MIDEVEIRRLYSNAEYEKVIKLLKYQEILYPTNVFLTNTIGASYSALGMTREALKYFQKSISLEPENYKPYYNLANLYRKLKKFQLAIKNYIKVLELNKTFIQSFDALVYCYIELDQYNNAIDILQKWIDIDSNNLSIKLNLANVLHQADKIDRSEELYNYILEVEPKNIYAHYNLAQLLHTQNRYNEAILEYKEVVKYKSDFVKAHYNMALIYEKFDDIDEALLSYKRVIQLQSNNVDAYIKIGDILKKQHKYDSALVLYQEALKYDKNSSKIYNSIGLLYRYLKNYNLSDNQFDKSIEVDPENKLSYYNKGLLYMEMSKIDEAIFYFDKSINIDNEFIEGYYSLAIAYSNIYDKNRVVELYNKVIDLDRYFSSAYLNLSQYIKYEKDHPLIDQIHFNLKNTKDILDYINYNYSLYKVYDDLGEYDKSFSYLKKANSLQHKENKYNIDKDIENFSKIKDIFYLDMPVLNKYNIRKEPIFIVGMPRSGTTLVEQIISSHSKVFGAGELDFLRILSQELIEQTMDRGFELDDIYKLGRLYNDRVEYLRFAQTIFIDKMPHNFIYIGFILSMFPDAKIVHLNRDPMAVCWSMYKTYFPAMGLRYSNSFDTLAKFFYMHEDMMEFWREKFPNKIYEIDYERLTTHQEEESKKLLEYCGLEWEDSCLEFYKNKRVVRTASSDQVRNGMYQGSSQAWKKYEKYLSPLRDALDREAQKREQSITP